MREDTKAGLVRSTLGELIDAGRLPSGYPFKLRPDTVETALAIGEAQDNRPWREKLLQAMAALESVNGQSVADQGGVGFLGGMPDTDIVFIIVAWTAETNGRAMQLDTGVPCPECNTPFFEVPLDTVGVWARPVPLTGADAIFDLKIDDKTRAKLPESVRDADFFIRSPTWSSARTDVGEKALRRMDIIDVYRARGALMYKPPSGSPIPVPMGMSKTFPMRVIRLAVAALAKNVPYIAREMTFECKKCGAELDIPFDQAGGSS
jgi:hypothetical protein